MPDMMITGVIDGPLPGGLPKAIQLVVLNDIPDLSIYGIGSANNGGGSDGEEFTLPADSASAGDIIYIASDSAQFEAFMGFAPDYTSGAANINGDDAVELFESGAVIDLFGDIAVDGTGQPWEFLDGWASRDPAFGPSPIFTLADWTFSGPNALDGEASNDTATTPFPVSFVPVEPTINELRLSSSGTDAESNFIEIHGEAGASLDGMSLVVLSGEFAPGQVDFAFDLTGVTIDADGFALIANDLNPELEIGDLGVAGLNLFGSPTTFLLVDGFTGAVGDDLDTDDDGIIDVAAWSEVLDGVSLVDGDANIDFNYSDTVIPADGNFVAAGVARETDGDGAFVALPFGDQSGDTPGATNVSDAPVDVVTIMEIQGAGHVSGLVSATPLDPTSGAGASARVQTSGIVTAVDTNGFYMQDAVGDGDIATSDAIFVFTGDAPAVAIGDAVDVEGTVSEFYPGGAGSGNLSTTQLGGAPVIDVVSSGNTLPAATILGVGGRVLPSENIEDDNFTSFDPTTDGIDFWESMEGMLVTAPDAVAVAGTSRFGEIFVTVDGGAGATGISERGTLNISPDDFNPEKVQFDADFGLTLPEVDVGAHFGDVTGVIGYDFGNYQIHPTSQVVVIEDSTLEGEITTLTASDNQLKIASYNVLNLETNPNDDDDDAGNGRFDAIAEQIVNNLGTPDIIGLQEIQDNSGSDNDGVTSASATFEALIAAIDLADDGLANDSTGYEYIDNTFIIDGASGGQPGGNIRTGFLYNTNRVDLVAGSVESIGGQGAGENFNGARLPLVATFAFNGEEITVINNHFSSKGGSAPIMGVEQDFADRQEDVDVNGSLDERQAQSAAVQDYIASLLADDADANVVTVGDFNEFEFISPVLGLETNLTNLVNSLDEDERYSFVFQGNSQSLDHILVSDGLLNNFEFDIVHVNSEFAEVAGRASDHDPLVALLTVGGPEINTSEVGVDYSVRRVFKVLAEQTVDGEVVATDRQFGGKASFTYDEIGVTISAVSTAHWQAVRFLHGEIGIRSQGEAKPGLESNIVDGGEALRFDLEDGAFGDATEVLFDFGAVRGQAEVSVTFYQDDILIETQVIEVRGGIVETDLDGATFDRVEISGEGDTSFTLDGFTFDRVVDDLIFS